MKTHSNGCKPRIAIALSGWNTSPSIRSLIAIAPTIVFKSSSGESTCSELDYEIRGELACWYWSQGSVSRHTKVLAAFVVARQRTLPGSPQRSLEAFRL